MYAAMKEYITIERNYKGIKMQRLSKDGYMFRISLFLAKVRQKKKFPSSTLMSCTCILHHPTGLLYIQIFQKQHKLRIRCQIQSMKN
jgi:hypothetical protein